MPRINLLPWREEDRKRRQREFGIATAGAVVVAVGAVLLTMFAYSQMIDDQKSRNQRLTDEHGDHRTAAEEPAGSGPPV